jgi:hypothetical protein
MNAPLTSFQLLAHWRTVRARGAARLPFDRLVATGLADWMPVEGNTDAVDYTLTPEGKSVAIRQGARLAA